MGDRSHLSPGTNRAGGGAWGVVKFRHDDREGESGSGHLCYDVGLSDMFHMEHGGASGNVGVYAKTIARISHGLWFMQLCAQLFGAAV